MFHPLFCRKIPSLLAANEQSRYREAIADFLTYRYGTMKLCCPARCVLIGRHLYVVRIYTVVCANVCDSIKRMIVLSCVHTTSDV